MFNCKKALCTALSICMLAGTAACGNSTQSASSLSGEASSAQPASSGEPVASAQGPASMPIVAEPIEVTAMGLVSPQGGDHNDTYCWTEYEKMTNIKITWENVPSDAKEERISVALASNQLPDMLYGLQIKGVDVAKYGAYGTFLPLEGLVEQYGYHFQQVMKEYPEVRKGITMPDGHIYALPHLKTGPLMKNNMHFINPEWLKRVNLEMPTSLAEYTEVLRAFRDQDANGNGDPNDEIPLAFRTSHLAQLMQTYFGLGTRGVKHQYVDVDSAGKIRFIPTSKEYKDMLTYLNMLYEEKLLDNEVFTMSASRDMVAKLTQDIVGSHADYSSNAGPKMQEIFRVIPLMDNYYGEKTWTRTEPTVANIGCFLLSSKTKYAPELLKWIDYFYSEEGQILYNLGIEGVTYEKTPQGDYQYTELLTNNPDGLTITQVRTKYMGFQAAAGIQSDTYYKSGETHWTSQEGLPSYIDYVQEIIWPEFPMNPEEVEEFGALLADTKAYADENFAAFVAGKRSLDDWDSYVAEFEKLNIARLLEMYSQISERYESQ